MFEIFQRFLGIHCTRLVYFKLQKQKQTRISLLNYRHGAELFTIDFSHTIVSTRGMIPLAECITSMFRSGCFVCSLYCSNKTKSAQDTAPKRGYIHAI